MNLKEIRKNKHLTQKEVAEHLLCSPTVYSRYETGMRQPPVDVLIKLSDLYGVTVDYLIGKESAAFEGLSDFERELIKAARKADERSRVDALILLQMHDHPLSTARKSSPHRSSRSKK